MLLLDTQVALWVVTDGPRLGDDARAMIVDDPLVHVSAASIWELTIKSMLGRVTVPDDLERALGEQGLIPLSITAAHASALYRFPEVVRHDPFDRLLMAQAMVEGMRLITADRVLLGLGHEWVVDASR
jgi:PIN domain nuclease of toxin-antitoxin system